MCDTEYGGSFYHHLFLGVSVDHGRGTSRSWSQERNNIRGGTGFL